MEIQLSRPVRLVAVGGLALALVGLASLLILGRGGTADAKGVPLTPVSSTAKPKPTTPAAPDNGLPASVNAELARNQVVVVALYSAGSTVDELALAEARAGARAGGAGFVPVNVLRERDGRAFALLHGVAETPRTLVYRAPAQVIFRLDGFADLDTVAQAAIDARRSR